MPKQDGSNGGWWRQNTQESPNTHPCRDEANILETKVLKQSRTGPSRSPCTYICIIHYFSVSQLPLNDVTQSGLAPEQLAVANTINRANYYRVDNSVQTTVTIQLVINDEVQY